MAVTRSVYKSYQITHSSDSKHSGRLTINLTTDDKMDPYAVYLGGLTATPHPIPPPYALTIGGMYVLDVQVSQRHDDNWRLWEAQVGLGPLPEGETGGGGEPNPFLRPPVYWFETVTEEQLVTQDYQDKAILNAAKDPYDEPIAIDRDLTVLVMERAYTSLAVLARLNKNYRGKLNSEKMASNEWDLKTVKCLGIDADRPTTEAGVDYYLGVARFIYRQETWVKKLLNRGWRYWTAPPGQQGAKIVKAKDDHGILVSSPINLRADGTKLAVTENATFISAQLNGEIDLNKLFLPYPQNEV